MEKKMVYIGLVAIAVIGTIVIAAFEFVGLRVIAAFVFLGLGNGQSNTFGLLDNHPVPAQLLSKLNISQNLSTQIGIGAAALGYYSKANTTVPLKFNGKPEVLYVGAEFCPFCAAQRWAFVVALMRFGTFSNLHLMTSTTSDIYPNTPTFTFYNSTYSSQYISFVSVETTTNKIVNGSYQTLQQPNATENAIVSKFNPGQSIPFTDIANKSVALGASFQPSIVSGMNWSVIAAKMQDPSTLQSQAIIGSANLITAQICKDINNTAPVCSQSYVTQIERNLA